MFQLVQDCDFAALIVILLPICLFISNTTNPTTWFFGRAVWTLPSFFGKLQLVRWLAVTNAGDYIKYTQYSMRCD
jgi:hypothetical protein